MEVFLLCVGRRESTAGFQQSHAVGWGLHRNKLTMIAEPLDRGLDRDIENGLIDLEAPKKQTSKFFMVCLFPANVQEDVPDISPCN